MLLIRGFEQRVSALYRDGEVPGFVHLSIGQEATAVGACWPLRPTDVITSTHRGHGHCLAKGLDPLGMFAELMGKDDGHQPRPGRLDAHRRPDARDLRRQRDRRRRPPDRGRRGDGRPAPRRRRRGGGVLRRRRAGPGRVPRGAEPRRGVASCRSCSSARTTATPSSPPWPTSTAPRSSAGPPATASRYVAVDGNDVVAVAARHGGRGRRRARAGGGPVVVEAATYRWHGHYEGDPERYRTADELEEWKASDPLVVHGRRLRDAGSATTSSRRSRRRWRPSSTRAVDAARGLASPAAGARCTDFVVRPRPERPEPAPPAGRRAGVPHDGRRPSRARGRAGDRRAGVRRRHRRGGRRQRVRPHARPAPTQFPGRVRDTPISETAVVGLGVGAAMAGMRPVVEVMYLDFLGVCFDQLLNQAAKLPFMTGGAAEMALTVRTQFGAGRSSGSQHSQSLEALLAHIPGLTVVMPSTPGRHLRPAAGRDPGPEPGGVHREPAALRHEGAAAARRPHRARSACRRSCGPAPTSPSCRCPAWCTRRWPPPRRWPARASRSR